MSSGDSDGLRLLALHQCGAVSRTQLRELGFSDRTVRTRLRSGLWLPRFHALLVIPSLAGGALTDAWALQLSAGDRAFISGSLAARVHGFDVEAGIPLVVTTRHHHHPIAGVRIIRRSQPAPPVESLGLRLASLREAIADALDVLAEPDDVDMLYRALQQRRLDVDDLDRVIAYRRAHHTVVSRHLRALAEHARSGVRSDGEARMGALLDQSGTGPWAANVSLVDRFGRVRAELDFAQMDLMLAIEVDGRAHHSDDRSFERDRRRQNDLVADGWMVLRFTWAQIAYQPGTVIRMVRRAVDQRQRSLMADAG